MPKGKTGRKDSKTQAGATGKQDAAQVWGACLDEEVGGVRCARPWYYPPSRVLRP